MVTGYHQFLYLLASALTLHWLFSPQLSKGVYVNLSQVMSLLCPDPSMAPHCPQRTGKVLTAAHRALYDLANISLPHSYFLPCSPCSNHTDLALPTCQAGFCLRAFAQTVPSSWNTLPPELFMAPSSPPSGLLKFHLVREAFLIPLPEPETTHWHSPPLASLVPLLTSLSNLQ